MDSLTPRDPGPTHLAARVVLITCLLAAGLWGARHPAYDPDAAPAADLAARVDPNTAPWWELAALPRLGRVKAERIIEHRQRRGRPFICARDLLEVSGIGPKTVAELEPLLTFEPDASASPPPP